jgi:segregation and condensation protein A
LQAFEGPLDLLLYLIRKHKFDIIDLPIFEITEQYMEYIEVMNELDLDLAAEYLLMAAILAEIKSRMLLPTKVEIEDQEQDPRQALVEHLKEYERYKQAAVELDQLPRVGRNYQPAEVALADNLAPVILPAEVELRQLFSAYAAVLKRMGAQSHHKIEREKLSTRARMSQILEQLIAVDELAFHQLFDMAEGRGGVVVSFIALLELAKERLISWKLTMDNNQLIVFKRNDSNEY